MFGMVNVLFFSRFPFNWKTPMGFLVACIMESFFFTALLEIALYVLLLYVGLCKHSMIFVDDIVTNLESISAKYDEYSNKSKLSEEKWSELRLDFLNTVKFHSEAVQLSYLDVSVFNRYIYLNFYFIQQIHDDHLRILQKNAFRVPFIFHHFHFYRSFVYALCKYMT